MDDVIVVEIFEGEEDTGHEKFGLVLLESSHLPNVVSQVSAGEKIHNQVEVVSILEAIVHVDEERVFELRQQVPFVHDGIDAALGYYLCLGHFFHGEE